MVDAYGCAGREVSVQLKRDGVTVDTQRFRVDTETYARRLSFMQKADRPGHFEYKLVVAPVPGREEPRQ